MDYRTKVLSKYFNLEAALPSGVAHAATRLAAAGSGTGIPTPQPPSLLNRLHELGSLDREVHEANNSMLEQVFKDERINLRQKENIAKAVLKGDYDIGSPTARADGTRPGRLAAVHDLDLAKGVGLLRRHRMKKPRFMELDGNQATIFIAKPSDLIAQEQAKRRSKEKKTGYFLFNKYVQEENMPVRPGKTLRALEESKAASEFAQLKTDMLLESKLSTILRGKEEVTKLVELAASEKRRYQEKVESKKDIRKKVEELRSKVHARLLEKKDPLAGKIIRAFDDKLAQAFMEHYRGYAMSADAIIATIGSRLGGAISSKEQAVMNVLEQAVGDYPSIQSNARPHSPSRDGPRAMEQVLDKMPYTGDYPLLGRSFGSRCTYRPRPVTPPPVIAVEDNENNGIIERSRGPRVSGSELLSPIKRPTSVGGWKDRDHSDALGKGWNANTPTLKRKGAGFSVYSSGDQLTGKDIGLLSSRPQTTSGRVNSSPSPATGGFPVVGDYALLSDSIASEMVDEDHETRHAITLLIDEMRGQGTLPSLQPERVFSDKQLELLGTHETTVDIIARELQWQQKKKAQAASKLNNEAVSHSSTGAGHASFPKCTNTHSGVSSAGGGGASGCDPAGNNMDVELGFQPRPISDGNFAAISAASIANRPTPSNEVVRITNATDIKIPRSLKTKKQTDPVEPYKSWDEKQNILNKGLAAGSGLALWTGSRVKEWGPRGKTPEGRYRVAHVPAPDDEQGKADNTSNKNAAAKNGRKKKMQMLS